MSNYHVILTIPCLWELIDHPHIKVTKCKMVINEKTGKILRYTSRGFYIHGKYYNRSDIRNSVRNIKAVDCLF